MNRRRRLGRIAAALLLAAAAVWWMARVPDRPLRVFRAIPAGADFVGLHDRCADRADALLASPPARLLAEQFGLTPAAWDAIRSDPPTRAWMRRLADGRVATASLPRPGGRRAWLAVSDIGARSIRLRWMLKLGALPSFRRFGAHGGRTLWILATEQPESPEQLAITFEEGLLIAVWTTDPGDLILALEAYDGSIESLASNGRGEEFLRRPAAPDRLWWAGAPAWPLGPAWIRIERADADGIEGQAEFPALLGRVARPGRGASAADAVSLFGPSAFAAVAFDPEWLFTQLQGLPAPGPAVLVLDYLRRETTSPAALGLFGGGYSGRLFGMKVPGVIGAAALRRPEAAPAALLEWTDRINAMYRAAVSLGPVPDPAGALLSVSISSLPFYAALPTTEQAAVAFRDNRMYAASNLDTLRAVLAAAPRGPATAPPARPATSAALRVNLKEGEPSIRNGLAVVALALMMQDREGTRAARAAIHRIRDTLLWLAPLGCIEADWHWSEDDTPVLRFAAGVPASTGGTEP